MYGDSKNYRYWNHEQKKSAGGTQQIGSILGANGQAMFQISEGGF